MWADPDIVRAQKERETDVKERAQPQGDTNGLARVQGDDVRGTCVEWMPTQACDMTTRASKDEV